METHSDAARLASAVAVGNNQTTNPRREAETSRRPHTKEDIPELTTGEATADKPPGEIHGTCRRNNQSGSSTA